MLLGGSNLSDTRVSIFGCNMEHNQIEGVANFCESVLEAYKKSYLTIEETEALLSGTDRHVVPLFSAIDNQAIESIYVFWEMIQKGYQGKLLNAEQVFRILVPTHPQGGNALSYGVMYDDHEMNRALSSLMIDVYQEGIWTSAQMTTLFEDSDLLWNLYKSGDMTASQWTQLLADTRHVDGSVLGHCLKYNKHGVLKIFHNMVEKFYGTFSQGGHSLYGKNIALNMVEIKSIFERLSTEMHAPMLLGIGKETTEAIRIFVQILHRARNEKIIDAELFESFHIDSRP